MRFHIGRPPATPNFMPKEEGWTPLREPSPWVINLIATPTGFLAAALIAMSWGADNFQFEVGSSSRFLFWMIGTFVLGLPALFAVHELIHALGYPTFGFTQSTMIFIWPSKLLIIAATFEALRRNRLLLVYMLPILVLSIIPLLVCRSLGVDSLLLTLVSTVNALVAGGDIFCFLLILFQVPRNAMVRNQGPATWWKTVDHETS